MLTIIDLTFILVAKKKKKKKKKNMRGLYPHCKKGQGRFYPSFKKNMGGGGIIHLYKNDQGGSFRGILSVYPLFLCSSDIITRFAIRSVKVFEPSPKTLYRISKKK